MIVPTSELFGQFFEAVSHMPFYTWDKDQMAEYLLAPLTYESKVCEALVNNSADIVMNFMGTPFEDDAVELANMLNRTGEHIYNELVNAGAYQNGYLFYQYHGWCGLDLVLGRFTPSDVYLPH